MYSSKFFRKDEVAGKIVVETSGKALGKTKDIAFGLDGTVAMIMLTNDNSEELITMDRVLGVGDYIVVKKAAPERNPSPAPVEGAASVPPAYAIPAPPPVPAAPIASICRNCGSSLRLGAKFCTKCGTPA